MNRRPGFATLALFLLFSLAASPAFAQGRATLNGVVIGPSGMPQPNVTLVLTNTQTNVDRRAVSDMDGAFVFGGLQPGSYRLRTDDDTFAPFSQDQMLAGGQTVAVRVALAPRIAAGAAPTARATVQGTVIGPDGRPFTNATVVLTTPAGIDRRIVTDASGAYIFGGLQPGTYKVRVDEMGALPFAENNLTLAPGEMRQFVIRLQPPPPPPPGPGIGGTGAVGAPPTPQAAGQTAVAQPAKKKEPVTVPEVTAPTGEFQAEPNRWQFHWPTYQRYEGNARIPWVIGAPLDPYNQNSAKGDFPIGNSQSLFANVNLQLNSTVNPRQVSGGQPASTSQFFYNDNFVGGLEIFRGDTVFQPKSWAVRGTVVGNLNGVSTNNPANNQTYGVEEAFAEKRLAVLSPSFDFVSIRGGMQNFNSDFRGYLFVDNQLGVRLFGNAGANRYQYNVVYFNMRQRDPNSQLHRIQDNRNQDVFIANWYAQDFAVPGYTAMFNFHLNRDSQTSPTQTGTLQVAYVGFHGDGTWGPWAVSHAFYEAFGKDDDNAIQHRLTGRVAPIDINAQMAALEISRDADWLRYRGSLFYASGDDGSDPTKGTGFDSITDNPNLAGGQFMFWTQQATKAPIVGLVSQKFSLLPNLRDKFTQRANFVNPGLVLVNGGVDLRVAPQLKLVTNVSYLKFADAAILQKLANNKGFEDNTIGLDISAGAKYRPFTNENMFVVLGFSTLMPKGGFATAVGSGALYSFVTAIQLAY